MTARCLPRPRPRTTRLRRRASALLAVSAACAVALSGCGLASGMPGVASNDPVTVMTWAPEDTDATNMPGMPAMAQAYARWVNAHGGIHGRPLKVRTCNDHNDTVGAARCASRAARYGAVAVVGSYSQHGRSFMSALERSGIPYIGGYGVAEEEFTSPLSYPVNGGVPALAAGNGRQLAAGDCRNTALVRPDTVAGDQLPTLLSSGLKSGGARPATDIRAPESASDYTRHARHALEASGADSARYGAAKYGGTASGSCVTAVLGGRTDTFFDSFRRLQHDSPRVHAASVLGSVRQSLVNRTGGGDSPLEGSYATGWYPVAGDHRWNPMKRVVRDYAFGDNRIDTTDPGVQTTWIAYTVLRQVLQRMDDDSEITPKSVRNALDTGKSVVTGGLTPKLSWNYRDMLAAHDHPRIVNTAVTFQRVRNGQLVAARDGFVDVQQTLESPRD